MQELLDYFGRSFYINLDHRPDRRKHFESLMNAYDFKAERFPGIVYKEDDWREACCAWSIPSDRLTGANSSHYTILQKAYLHKWDKVLIFEDDIYFVNNKEKTEKYLEEIIKQLEEQTFKCDVFYFGINLKSAFKVSENLIRPFNSPVVMATSYSKLAMEYLLECRNRYKIFEAIDQVMANDVQLNLTCYCANPMLVSQIQDINEAGEFTDQGGEDAYGMLNRFNEIVKKL